MFIVTDLVSLSVQLVNQLLISTFFGNRKLVSYKIPLEFNWGRLDLAVLFTPFTLNRQNRIVHGPGGVTMHPPKGSLGVV